RRAAGFGWLIPNKIAASLRRDVSLLVDRQRAGTDLVIGALLARLHTLERRRAECARADLRRRARDDGAHDAHVGVGRLDHPTLACVQEVKSGFRWSRPVHLLV